MQIPDPTRPLSGQPVRILLAMALFGEARNQPHAAMLGVANVIKNRVEAPRNGNGKRFGAGWSGVILRPGAFDCLKPTDPNYRKVLEPLEHENPRIWERCLGVADSVLDGEPHDNTSGATHYHDQSILPWWARQNIIDAGRMIPTVKIGAFSFYREP